MLGTNTTELSFKDVNKVAVGKKRAERLEASGNKVNNILILCLCFSPISPIINLFT